MGHYKGTQGFKRGKPDAEVVIYTDGACHPNPGKGGWAAAVTRGGDLIHAVCGGAGHTTNNRMEMIGIGVALAWVRDNGHAGRCAVASDSQLVLNTLGAWAAGWRRRGWSRANGEEIKNLDLVKRVYPLYEEVRQRTDLYWVKGHAGIYGNELADYLASLGREMQARTEFANANAINDLKNTFKERYAAMKESA